MTGLAIRMEVARRSVRPLRLDVEIRIGQDLFAIDALSKSSPDGLVAHRSARARLDRPPFPAWRVRAHHPPTFSNSFSKRAMVLKKSMTDPQIFDASAPGWRRYVPSSAMATKTTRSIFG